MASHIWTKTNTAFKKKHDGNSVMARAPLMLYELKDLP